ncbi:unnamed protein product, partial [Rotaria socialis]
MKAVFPTEKAVHDHFENLLRILSYEPLYAQIRIKRSNDETVLVGSSLIYFLFIVQMRNMDWLSDLNTTLKNTMVSIIDASINDEVAMCCYGVLCEILTDEESKDLSISDNICNYFLQMLEDIWNKTKKKYEHVPIMMLLKGFQTLSKNDSMQQETAVSNRIHIFIEICDEYPIAYDVIWALSFNKDIQQQLRSDSPFICKLTQLSRQPENEQMSKIIDGILWNLEINHENRSMTDKHNTKEFDIMI